MGELHDRGDQPDPGDEPGRDKPDRPPPISDGREIDFDDPKWRAEDFALGSDEQVELDSTGRTPRVPKIDAEQPDADKPEAAPDNPREQHPSRADEPDTPEHDERPTETPQPVEPEADAPSIAEASDDRPVKQPVLSETSEQFGTLFTDHQHEPFDMDRHESAAAYAVTFPNGEQQYLLEYDKPDQPRFRWLTPEQPEISADKPDEPLVPDPNDRPPNGEELIELEPDGQSWGQRLRAQAYREADKTHDALKDSGNSIHTASHHPPMGTGQLERQAPGPVIDQQHHAIDSGDAVAAGVLTVAMAAELGGRFVRHWREFRKGRHDADHR